jgi:hypothetical protein
MWTSRDAAANAEDVWEDSLRGKFDGGLVEFGYELVGLALQALLLPL